ncbi:MAG TPA: BON domain-containing protein [Thermoanaerobaculia bacterium]|nr:BON domain-containing protein [Thermoanaerobaculia bacterium]
MANRYGRDDYDERNRGEFSTGFGSDFSGYYARDPHRGGLGDDYARDTGWSGGGRGEDYVREHDVRRPGPDYRGKGPRNWRPSDERIREVVNERLTDHAGIDATDVEVTVENGEVTLSGDVGSRYQKRLAEDIAADCRGVHDVHNRLKVADLERQIGKASE